MKRLLLLSVMCLTALTSCKKESVTAPVCDIANRAVAGAAQGVAEALGCSNVAAVQATLTQPIADLKMCQEGQQGLVGNLVCAQAAKFVINTGVAALPAEWGCTGGKVGVEAETAIMDNCKRIITF